MMQHLIENIKFDGTQFSVLAFLICVLLMLRLFYKAHKDASMDWSDILTVNGPSNKVCLHKVMTVVGLVIGSWVVMHMTIMGSLSFDIFGLYLSYVAGIDAYSKFLAMKRGNKSSDKELTQTNNK